MTDKIFITPGKGRLVRHPDGSRLKDEGELVSPSTYWQRRLADEDVVAGDPPKPAKSQER